MILKFIRWLLGYVQFIVRGNFKEIFINLATKEKINLWDMKRENENLISKTFASDYKKLHPIAKKSGVRVRLQKKYGLPFFIFRYRKRLGIIAGTAVCAIVLYTLSLYVWNIEVTGNNLLSKEEILCVMKDLGVSPGSLRSRIDVPIVQQNAMLKLPNTAWLSVNMQGSYVNVAIKEKISTPEIVTKDKPCNIKAAIDGQVERIETYKGTASVTPGDAVIKGQLLISGIVEDANGCNAFVHSDGKVFAQTKRQYTEKVELSQITSKDTGKVIKRYRIKIFGLEIPINSWKQMDETYRAEVWNNTLKIGKTELPVIVHGETWYEQEFSEKILTYEEALSEAKEKVNEMEQNDMKDKKILRKEENAREENGVCYLDVEYKCIEDISEREEIIFE